MTVNNPPTILPTRKPNRQRFRRPWNSDPSCVLNLMPEVNSTWRDYSGHGNDGTIVGPTTIYNARYGEGLLFDGINDYVNCGDDASMKPVDAITLEAWVYLSSVAHQHVLIGNYAAAGNRSFLLYFGNVATGVSLFLVADDLSTQEAFCVGITQTGWYHIAGTYDGAHIIVYLDGIAGVPVAWAETLDATTANVTLGWASGYTQVLEGILDEARIYNRALKAWEVRALYEQGRP